MGNLSSYSCSVTCTLKLVGPSSSPVVTMAAPITGCEAWGVPGGTYVRSSTLAYLQGAYIYVLWGGGKSGAINCH